MEGSSKNAYLQHDSFHLLCSKVPTTTTGSGPTSSFPKEIPNLKRLLRNKWCLPEFNYLDRPVNCHFFSTNVLLGSIFSPHENCINFAYMATFSTSHTCHTWRISDFSTSVMWRQLKFLHMMRNFQFPHNCHTWKAEISPHDNFFSTNIIRDIRDKYQVCTLATDQK